MSARSTIAVDLGRRRLRAIEAAWDRGRLVVKRVLVEPVPDDLDTDDAKAVGAWAGGALRRARFGRGRIALALSREDVVLKRLTLPTTDRRELPGMTRLAIQRDLPFDPAGAVIDFVPLHRGETSTTIQAAAASETVLSAARQAAKAAGHPIERLALRSAGCAALLGTLPDRDGAIEPRAVLVVDVTGERVEFTVVAGGAVRFSRAGELPALDDPKSLAEAIVTEARRTWMSYRIVDDSDDVRRAVVIGDREVAALVAGSIGDILRVETAVFDDHPLVESADDPGETWPLAGLLLGANMDVESIDFAHPRRAPDRAAVRRKLALGAVALLVVAAGAAVTVARRDLADLRYSVETLQAQQVARRPDYLRYGRDVDKLAHLELWESASTDWLDHLAYTVGIKPGSDRVVLDGWAGALAFGGVGFDRKTGRFSAPREIRITLEGEAADRAAADGYRGALVETAVYEISTSGPDAASGRRLPYSFHYRLQTEAASPRDARQPGEPPPGDQARAR